jgi:antitoxin YefM
VPVKIMSDSDCLARYAAVPDSAVDDREVGVITRAGRPCVVVMALDEWESMKETARTTDGGR